MHVHSFQILNTTERDRERDYSEVMSGPGCRADGPPTAGPSRPAAAMAALPAPAVSSGAEPLLSFREALNPRSDFDQLERLLAGQLNAGETASLRDFKLYIIKGEAAWVLDQAGIESNQIPAP